MFSCFILSLILFVFSTVNCENRGFLHTLRMLSHLQFSQQAITTLLTKAPLLSHMIQNSVTLMDFFFLIFPNCITSWICIYHEYASFTIKDMDFENRKQISARLNCLYETQVKKSWNFTFRITIKHIDRHSVNCVGSAKSSFKPEFHTVSQNFREYHPVVMDSAK